MLSAVLVGVGATAFMDVTSLVRARLGVAFPDYALVGRWLAHAAQGLWDVWSADGIRLPAWYGGLRARTTPLTVMLLIAGFFAGGN